MHTVIPRQSTALPDRPRKARGRLQVPNRGSAPPRHKQTMDIRPKKTAGVHKHNKKAVPVVSSSAVRLAKTAKQADILSRSLEKQARLTILQTTPKSPGFIRSIFSRRNLTGLAVALILVGTGYVTVDTWLTNRQVTAQAAGTQPSGDSSSPAARQHEKRSEGRDETPLPANALETYSVAADKPRALYIDKLGLKARVLPVGVNTDNSMQAPENVFDTGWYTGSSEPGELGAVAIDGHSSGATQLGAFGKLGELAKGDIVTIEKGDGKKIKYEVVAKETVDRGKVDMRKFLLPYGDALKGANFITCSGDWTDDNSTMTERTIIYTEQVG